MAPPLAGDITGLDRFQALWRRCLLDSAPDNSADIHQLLLRAYREPQRRYHTLAHIRHCLTMFEQCKPLLQNPDALEIAIWFHDAVFEPGCPDNEARSAALYQRLSDDAHPPAFRALVERLIMATLHDGNSLDDSDAQYMVDIDLSSFGLTWEEFLRDSQQLREESPQLEDAVFYRRQGEFQTNLLARSRFYHSDFFYQRYEKNARENLARYFEYLDRLGNG